jgi:hypothetical protein
MVPAHYLGSLFRLARESSAEALPPAHLEALLALGLVRSCGEEWVVAELGRELLAIDTRRLERLRIVLQELKCPTCKFGWDFIDDEDFVYAGEDILCLTGCCFFPVTNDTVKCWAQDYDRLTVVPVQPGPAAPLARSPRRSRTPALPAAGS